MGRVLLTVWFAFMALFGSRVCCCATFAASPALAGTSTQPELICACCVEEAPCCEGPVGPASPAERDPCPCEKARLAMADLVPGASQSLDWDGELRFLAPASFVGLSSFAPAVAGASPLTPEPPPLAGRALLASYSILRC